MNQSQTRFLLIAGILCALCVMLGAFGSHALKSRLSPETLLTFDKGVRYQFIHSVSLMIFVLLPSRFQTKLLHTACWFICIGIFFFSGSIYLLATRTISGLENISWLVPLTPIGGACLSIAWVLFSYNIYQNRNAESL